MSTFGRLRSVLSASLRHCKVARNCLQELSCSSVDLQHGPFSNAKHTPVLPTYFNLISLRSFAVGEPLPDTPPQTFGALGIGRDPPGVPKMIPSEVALPVVAQYVGSNIEIREMQSQPELRGCWNRSDKDSVIFLLNPEIQPGKQQEVDAMTAFGLPLEPYMVAYKQGSVVFYNVRSDDMRVKYFEVCKRLVKESPIANFALTEPITEEFKITVKPDYLVMNHVAADNITLQQLDLRTLGVISRVLSQSVAMEFCNRYVDEALGEYMAINKHASQTGEFPKQYSRFKLLKMVADNNLVIGDVLHKLRILEIYGPAWKSMDLDKLWNGLRSELEVAGRFESLCTKLEFVQETLKYFLELLQSRKSDMLEWTIIILIAGEIILGLVDMWFRLDSLAS